MESRLGQQSYWDEVFSQEAASLQDTEDYDSSCEDWFGPAAQRKVSRMVSTHVPLTAMFVDLGCGNGCSLEKYREMGFERLYGVDFSLPAVELARERVPTATVEQGDLVSWRFETDSDQVLIHDKGTLDAFLLNKAHTIEQYRAAIESIAARSTETWLVVTCCNYTYQELCTILPYPEVDHIHDFPTFSFGGSSGSTLASVLFRMTS